QLSTLNSQLSTLMSDSPTFVQAFPYQDDVLALPVTDIDSASTWYGQRFGMTEVERREDPPTVILERDGTRIGFAINGGDASQDGAAILVSEIDAIRQELEARGLEIGDPRVDERDGKRFRVFFVVAPDGLCFYFHEPLPDTAVEPATS
ncbi:MAG: VOC family protein, partial [Planctomycetota bacterium]